MRGLRDSSKSAYLLGDPRTAVNVAAVQDTHFICAGDCRVLKVDFVVFSAFGSLCSAGISLLVWRSLNAIVNLVFAGKGGRLIVADVAVKSFDFQAVAVYAPICVSEKRSFFRRFFDISKRFVLMGDWNAIFDHKLDKGGWGASGLDWCESSLINLLAEHYLACFVTCFFWITGDLDVVRRFVLWPDSVLSEQSVRRADSDFVTSPTFYWIEQSDHKIVRVCLRLASTTRLAGYRKFNTSLLEIGDFRERLETLIKLALVEAVTGNEW